MKKLFALSFKKGKLYLILSFSMLLLFVNSCKKELHFLEENDKATIASLKEYYEGYIQQNSNLGFTSSIKPNWDKVFETEENGVMVFEIACDNPGNIINAPKGSIASSSEKEASLNQTTIKLLLFADVKGKKWGGYMFSNGSSTKIEETHYREFKNFTGSVMFYNLESNFGNGYLYKDGTITNSINIAPKDAVSSNQMTLSIDKPSGSGNGKIMLNQSVDCTIYIWDVYAEVCGYPGYTGEPQASAHGTGSLNKLSSTIASSSGDNCFWVYAGSFETMNCIITNSGGGDPPSGYTPPTTGGSSGNGTTSTKDIRNKTNDPCISKTVNAALTANKDVEGIMADIIKKFDSDKTVTINVFDGHIYYKDVNGNETTVPKPGQTSNQQFFGNTFSANITLGIDYHANTSKENIIVSMIHEIVHAYLGYSSNNFLKTETDHNVIANKYITPMATYLNQYLGVSLKDAYALAWSGVPDSKVYMEADDDFEYTMSDGNKITKAETRNLSGPYKLATNVPANNGYTKGTKICD